MEIDKNFHDQIADLCLKQFKALPKSGKPKQNEWTVLSCIILELNYSLEVIALGTGSKCIGESKMSASGDILNDSHAEVMCRRFHFFTTHVPCGDAAIFSKQYDDEFGCVIKPESSVSDNEERCDYEVPAKKMKTNEGSDIFRTGAKCLAEDERRDLKLQGSSYHVLGVVRTKPGRGDPTLSVSCSDKLSKWCHLGIQGALLYLLLDKPIYLSSFTITANTPFCKNALERALYDRLGDVQINYPFSQNRICIGQSSSQFEFSKEPAKQPSPCSISWCKINEKNLEVAVDGRRQGVTKKNINTSAGRLSTCKHQFFKCFIEIHELHNLDDIKNDSMNSKTYSDVKMLSHEYKQCWNILKESFKVWTRKNEKLLHFYNE